MSDTPTQERQEAAHPTCCSAHNRSGNRCRKPVQPGSNVCRYHGGLSPQVRRVASERAEAEVLMRQQRALEKRLHSDEPLSPSDVIDLLAIEIDPHEALVLPLLDVAPDDAAERPALVVGSADQPNCHCEDAALLRTGEIGRCENGCSYVWYVS